MSNNNNNDNNNENNHDNNNENNNESFILIIKNTNKEFTMKTYYSSLIVLSILEIAIIAYFYQSLLSKKIYSKIIFILVMVHSIIYLIFAIYYTIKFKICRYSQKEIVSKMNQTILNSYKKITKILLLFGAFVSTVYIFFVFIYICTTDSLIPSCDELVNKKNFEKILNLKSCEYNKCYNIKNNYNNKGKENDVYKYNYLCNTKLSNYLINSNDENKIKCENLPKEKKNNIFISSKSLNAFYKDKNITKSKSIYYFSISCDYDYNKLLYICNSINELNQINYNISDFTIINDYNEYNDVMNDIKETRNDINYKKGECITLYNFLLFILLNLLLFFILPIKVDIWYNENKRFEIIKKKIHPNRLRVNNEQINNINYDNLSISTDNSSDKSSDSSISDNSQTDSNVFAIIQN